MFPGVIFVFSLYYRRFGLNRLPKENSHVIHRKERHWRVAFFFGGAALAGAFGGAFIQYS